jgi:hypothetical protein
LYGELQALSRAFRSRFLELHVGDIPDAELATILQERCALAPSYAAKLVTVMRELQRRRQARALLTSPRCIGHACLCCHASACGSSRVWRPAMSFSWTW